MSVYQVSVKCRERYIAEVSGPKYVMRRCRVCLSMASPHTWARICKRLRRQGIDSEDLIPPAYVAWRAGTTNRVVVPACQAGNWFLGSLKGLQIRALASGHQWLDTEASPATQPDPLAAVKYGVRSPKFIWASVYSCSHWLRPRNSSRPSPRTWGLGTYTRVLLVSKDRRHLFVIPCPPNGATVQLRAVI